MGVIHAIVFLAIGGKIARGQEDFPGGERIFVQDAPYFVSIRSASRHIGGGVLVRNDLVLTSARVVLDDSVTVVSGVDEDNPFGTVHQLAEFDVTSYPRLGQLRLSNPISIDDEAEAINRPIYELSYNETAHFISFKRKNAQLRRTEVTIAPWHVCTGDDTLLCATRKFNRVFRRDEIGGPLVHHGRLIGIATPVKSLNAGYDVYVDFRKIYAGTALENARSRPRGQQ